ncbi:MAG: hypothetical protein WDA11_09385 [Thiohalomonadaceae bacterium]
MIPLLIWDELAALWDEGDFRTVHDWINERWSRVIQTSPQGDRDPFARFLQGLAFAALAFHFAREQNTESTRLFVDDALAVLPNFAPIYAGVELNPIIDSLHTLAAALPGDGSDMHIPERALVCGPLRFSSRVAL